MRRLTPEEREERGLPGPAMALALLVGLLAAIGLMMYGGAWVFWRLAEWVGR
jgi:hypothetical protein